MSTRAYYSVLLSGIRYIKRSASMISGGQASSFAVIQQAHKLEKGLSIRSPRKLWGFDNAKKLVDFIAKEESEENKDEFSIHIGKDVLAAYLAHKEQVSETDHDEREKLADLKAYAAAKLGPFKSEDRYGGTIRLHKEDVLVDEEAVAPLFLKRHSVRDYADTPVDREKLEKAISLALRAPSACNRQPTQIYVISGDDRVKIGSDNSYHADKYLILTGEMNAFSLPEINDWVVSTSVFAAYLTLALHAEGIGSCVFRKDIVRESKYNDAIRKLCGIPENEQIILEIAIGNYKDEFNVPVSYRREAKDIVHYID